MCNAMFCIQIDRATVCWVLYQIQQCNFSFFFFHFDSVMLVLYYFDSVIFGLGSILTAKCKVLFIFWQFNIGLCIIFDSKRLDQT